MKSIIQDFKLMSRWQQILIILLATVNLLYLVYYAYWSFNTCAHYDDLRYLRDMGKMSMGEYLCHEYITSSGRIVWLAIYGCMFKFSLLVGSIRFWPFLFLLIGYGITWIAIRNLKVNENKILLFLFSIFCYNLYVHTAIDYAVFVWICAMLYYLLAPCLLLFMVYLSKDNLSKKQWFIFCLLILSLGGLNEAFTPVALVTMFMYGVYIWKGCCWNIKETWSKVQVRRLVYSTLAVLAVFTIMLLAPGNYARLEEDAVAEGFARPEGIVGWGKAIMNCLGIFSYFMIFYLPYYIVPLAISFYVGTKNKIQQRCVKTLIIATIVFAVYAIICVVPIAFVYNGFGIQRLYTYLVFGLIGYICVMGYILGSKYNDWQRKSLIFACFGVMLMLSVVTINLVKDVPVMKCYSKAVDERKEYLLALNANGQTECVEVEPYPNMDVNDIKFLFFKYILGKKCARSALYYRADTGIQPTEYEKYYRELYGLNFDFVLPSE